jgi:hypothetical protein
VSRQLIRLAFAVSVLGMAAAAYGQSTGLTVSASKGPVEAPRFYGFTFDFTASDSSGLNSVGQNYANDLILYFEPTWNIGKQFLRDSKHWRGLHLAGRFVVTQNLAGVTDSNFSGVANAGPSGTCFRGLPSEVGGVVDPTQVPYCNPIGNDRRTDYSDLWLTLRAPRVVTIPKLGLPINPSLRVILPTSEQSRFQTLIMAVAIGVGTGRALPFWKDRIRLGYSFLFNKNFHQSPSPIFRSSPQSNSFQGPGSITNGSNPYDYSGTASANYFVGGREGAISNSNDYSFLNIFSGGIQFHEKVSFDAFYIISSGIRYGQDCTGAVNVQGQDINLCQTGDAVAGASGTFLSRPGFSHTQVLWVTLSYQVLDYLGLSLAWINSAPLTYRNGTYRQGVVSVDYDAFSSLSISATLSIDGVANKLWPKKKPAPTKSAGLPFKFGSAL